MTANPSLNEFLKGASPEEEVCLLDEEQIEFLGDGDSSKHSAAPAPYSGPKLKDTVVEFDADEDIKGNDVADDVGANADADEQRINQSSPNSSLSLESAALDSILNVNSFFAVALFVGLTSAPPKPLFTIFNDHHHIMSNITTSGFSMQGLLILQDCGEKVLDPNTGLDVLVQEMVSFSCFFCSTLLAVGLKLMLNLTSVGSEKPCNSSASTVARDFFHIFMFLSFWCSVVGMVMIVLALVSYVQLFAGPYPCSKWAVRSIIPLIVLSATGLLFVIVVFLRFTNWLQVLSCMFRGGFNICCLSGTRHNYAAPAHADHYNDSATRNGNLGTKNNNISGTGCNAGPHSHEIMILSDGKDQQA